jgi:hypothetical protein
MLPFCGNYSPFCKPYYAHAVADQVGHDVRGVLLDQLLSEFRAGFLPCLILFITGASWDVGCVLMVETLACKASAIVASRLFVYLDSWIFLPVVCFLKDSPRCSNQLICRSPQSSFGHGYDAANKPSGCRWLKGVQQCETFCAIVCTSTL